MKSAMSGLFSHTNHNKCVCVINNQKPCMYTVQETGGLHEKEK